MFILPWVFSRAQSNRSSSHDRMHASMSILPKKPSLIAPSSSGPLGLARLARQQTYVPRKSCPAHQSWREQSLPITQYFQLTKCQAIFYMVLKQRQSLNISRHRSLGLTLRHFRNENIVIPRESVKTQKFAYHFFTFQIPFFCSWIPQRPEF